MEMTGYTKLFGSIIASTIWREPDKVRIVWITMLALANKNGVVAASIPGLADLSRVSIEDCESALSALAAPDKYSRTPDHEGRRIEKVDGGWAILNHAKYREKMSADERRAYLREKQAEQRAKKKAASVNTVSTNVKERQQKSTASTQSKADADTKAVSPSERSARRGQAPCTREEAYDFGESIGMPKDAVDPWYDHFDSNGWLVGGKAPMKDWHAAMRNGKRQWEKIKAQQTYGTNSRTGGAGQSRNSSLNAAAINDYGSP